MSPDEIRENKYIPTEVTDTNEEGDLSSTKQLNKTSDNARVADLNKRPVS